MPRANSRASYSSPPSPSVVDVAAHCPPIWLLRFPFDGTTIVSDRTGYRVTCSFSRVLFRASTNTVPGYFEEEPPLKGTFYRAYLRAIFTVADNAMPRLRRSGWSIVARKSAQSGLYREIASFYTTRYSHKFAVKCGSKSRTYVQNVLRRIYLFTRA